MAKLNTSIETVLSKDAKNKMRMIRLICKILGRK